MRALSTSPDPSAASPELAAPAAARAGYAS